MTDNPSRAQDHGLATRFEFLPPENADQGGQQAPATVRAVGEIDLTNVEQFAAVLDRAVAELSAVTVDLIAVTYCDSATIRALFMVARRVKLTIQVGTSGSVTETLMKVSGLDQVATVVTLD